MSNWQEALHPEGHDYLAGSPHLRHEATRTSIVAELAEAVRSVSHGGRRVRVLEVGGGHGTFTDALLSLGCQVTVTEMSRPSADFLRQKYASSDAVEVMHVPSGEPPAGPFDGVVAISVLHHIPDYLAAIQMWTGATAEGGFFYSAQDPLLYARIERQQRAAAEAAYFLWRLRQPDLRRGIATRARRARGIIDESKAEDMTEYHVVRDGVDQQAISRHLGAHYEITRRRDYWSTQGRLFQRLGEGRAVSHFSLTALGRA